MSANKQISRLQTSKVVNGIIILGVIFLAVVWMILVQNSTKIKQIDGSIFNEKHVDDGYSFALDEVKFENDGIPITKDMLSISGWLIKKGVDTTKVKLRVVLKNEETGEYLMLPTTLLQRTDVTTAFNDGHTYDISGFRVCIPQMNIDLQNKSYFLMALYSLNGQENLIDFGKRITFERST